MNFRINMNVHSALKSLCFSALICLPLSISAQISQSRPKLVVGIVVDQMRWDYLIRYDERYGEGGFKRLMSEGYNCNRTLINYLPAVTAVGHTSVYTGSVPALNGIVGNNFFVNGKYVYCTDDTTVNTVGSKSSAGKMSPRNLLATTITDELRLATNFRSKVIGVSLKDRASILPAGHSANAAYWMDSKSTDFITSTYYMDKLPKWIVDFNKSEKSKIDEWLSNGWTFLYPEDTYVQSAEKNERYEMEVGKDVRTSPIGNTVVLDLAKATIKAEQMGQGEVTDFLCVSLSTTDYVGHRVGPNSPYIEDVYLRLDKDLSSFFDYLDTSIGKDNYLLFLTADHAGSHNAAFRLDHKLPASVWVDSNVKAKLDSAIRSDLGAKVKSDSYIKSLNCFQVHFDHAKLNADGIDEDEIEECVIKALLGMKYVSYAFSLSDIPSNVPEPIRTMTVNGYNSKRGGDIQIILENGCTEAYSASDPYKGTNHAVWSPYDTHIPLIFMGKGVPYGWDNSTHHITDISATIAALLNIQQPSACVGEVIEFKK